MDAEEQEKEESLTISQLEEAVKLPVSTLRFYEQEFPFYIRVHKTAGGHRRYSPENVRRFLHLKTLIHEKGLSLKDVKRSLASDEDPEKMREEMDLLLKVTEELTQENLLLKKSIQQLGKRVTDLEEELRNSKKSGFRWFKS
jgi:DNA-binding transcriptional MerR regulator